MPGRLENVKAVITGGGGAIGMATAEAFLKEGALVFVTDYNTEIVDRALKSLKVVSNSVFGCPADVTSKSEVELMMEKADSSLNGITALINNAGTVSPGYLVTNQLQI